MLLQGENLDDVDSISIFISQQAENQDSVDTILIFI